MHPSSLPVSKRITLLVRALNGAEKTNQALATCADGDAMVDILWVHQRSLALALRAVT